MNNEELIREIKEQRILLEKIFISTEKTRKYFLWTMIITAILFVLPLILMVVAVPFFMDNYINALNITGI